MARRASVRAVKTLAERRLMIPSVPSIVGDDALVLAGPRGPG